MTTVTTVDHKENSHHSCFSDGSEAVDEDVTGDVDGRT